MLPVPSSPANTLLELRADPLADGYTVQLKATDRHGKTSRIVRTVPADWLTGGLALVCSSGPVGSTPVELEPVKDFSFYPPNQASGGTMRFWLRDWMVSGSKVDGYPDRMYGPVLFTLYTVSRGTLKLSAQFPPLGERSAPAELQIRASSGAWLPVASAVPDPDAWNAVFRVSAWDSTRDVEYRVLYSLADRNGTPREYSYGGMIRKDPVDKQNVNIALLTCLWDFGFPHDDLVKHLGYHQPELLLWTGDQIYESVGGYGVIETRAPDRLVPAMQDFLRKWFIFGWAVGDLTRDIPSVCMTDDHDMFHGNIWGCGGRPTNPALGEGYGGQDSGGYKMSPRWVNMVQRAQTAHLPDPFDPTPVMQGIGTYYTSLEWGGISFAILEDRKWKSAPRQQLPGAEIVNGFARNRAWNSADEQTPDGELLGQRQLDFLEYWATEWSGGTWLKFAVSQTPFCCLHTEPKGVYVDDGDPEETIPEPEVYLEGDHKVADHDSGGWPKSGRDAAIAKFRKAFAAHISGDQHLGTAVHYGLDEFRDAVYSLCTPAMSNIWPRRWFPPDAAPNSIEGLRYTGDHVDAFGNRVTVLAVANPARYPGPGLDGLRFRVTGYTILSCDRINRTTVATAWPRWIDPSRTGAQPYHGWPVTVQQLDNGMYAAPYVLDQIETGGFRDAVVQVQDEATGDVVYTLRIQGTTFAPPVRRPGTYKVVAYDPDGDYRREWMHVQARRVVRTT